MDFQTVQRLALERAAQIGDLLDVADRLGKGEEKPKFGQIQALKLAIDTRLRLLDLWVPKEQVHTLKNFVIKRDEQGVTLEASSEPTPSPTG